MSLSALSSEEKTKLKNCIDTGLKVMQEVDDLKSGLRDTLKNIAEELDIKVSTLNRAVKSAFKASIGEEREEVDQVSEILHIVGRD